MYFKSKRISLIILGLTSMVCSRAMFWFFDDPEGPNLLIVTGMAAVLYFLSLKAYQLIFSTTGFKRLFLAIATQIIIATTFFLSYSVSLK